MAILKAVKYVADKNYKALFNILSDSRSAIQTICDPSSLNPIAAEIRGKIMSMEHNKAKIMLYWINTHNGIQGNEKADVLVKRAALKNKQRPAYDRVPLSYAKRLAKWSPCSLQVWQKRYEASPISNLTKIFFPDILIAYKIIKNIKKTHLTTQLFTGHGVNKAYLYKYKLSSSPGCICDENLEQTVEHLLIDCPRFSKTSFESECSMGVTIKKDNLSIIMQDNNCRTIFMKFALRVLRIISKENGSKHID
ncbi:unnamed protein product [Parnassius mnemosyne]|uniref:RNase H type-1 domain-containing protein n=1 Tax=Parnassius mnemosyne TaxID=213953 RepID=A0AAV1LNU6_9NEOP